MAKFINPFTDFGFKRLFGQEDHKNILIGFLNALFKGEFVVNDLVYRDKEQPGEIRQNRTVIYDIYCSLDDGSHVIVEMQNKREMNFDARALYYASRSVVAQGEKGDHWHYDYAPVIGVYFLNYLQEGLERAFRSDFEIMKTRTVFAHSANTERYSGTTAKPQSVPFKGLLRMVFLQMPAFTKTEAECFSDLDKWAYIMNHMEKLTSIPWAAQDELYAELAKVSNVAALSPKERAVYDETLKQFRDNLAMLEAAIQDGREEGLKEGREERSLEIARRLIALNVDDSIVVQSTGLLPEDVQKLKACK